MVEASRPGSIVHYEYDGLGRIRTVAGTRLADGAIARYEYTYEEPGGEGLLASVGDAMHAVQFQYDSVGRVTEKSLVVNGVPLPISAEWRFDADGDVVEMVYPSGLRVVFDRRSSPEPVVT